LLPARLPGITSLRPTIRYDEFTLDWDDRTVGIKRPVAPGQQPVPSARDSAGQELAGSRHGRV
jgi:hypothetical protein